MFLAVAGLVTFTANIASAQDENAAPAAQEQVADEPAAANDDEVVDLFAGSGEEIPLHQALKTKFIEGGAGFMSLIVICLILGLALAIERILYLAFSKTNTTKLLEDVEKALQEGGVEKAKEVDADLIMMSTLMTTTMPGMKEVINKLKEQGIRDSIKVMVGGSPISQKYADDIGADGYSRNAVEAVEVAKRLCGVE